MLFSFQFIILLGIVNLGCSIRPAWRNQPRPWPLSGVMLAIMAVLVTDWVYSPANARSPYLPATSTDFMLTTAVCLTLALAPYPVFRALAKRLGLPATPPFSRSTENLLRSWFAQYGHLEMIIGRSLSGAGCERFTLQSFRHLRRILAERSHPDTVAEIHIPNGEVLNLRRTPGTDAGGAK